jgi:hypothetical protein
MYVDVGRQLLLTLAIGGAGDPFDNTNAFLGVGDSTDPTTDVMDDLQGVSKEYFPMDVGYPQLDGNEMVFQATVGTADANFAWEEIGLFNGNTPPTSVMLARVVESRGTKVSGDTWTLIFRLQIP